MGYAVGIVGATGAVGLEILQLLEKTPFPIKEIRCFGSARSQGKKLPFLDASLTVETLSSNSFSGLDIVFFSAGSARSKEFAPLAQKAGALVIDNSSAFREDPTIPLVIPEVNPKALINHEGLIANPNCAVILLLVALAPLHAKARLRRIVVSTYQAASGAGRLAMEDLVQETKAQLLHESYTRQAIPYPYAFNLFLHNSPLGTDGYVEEERKIRIETQKILEDDTIKIAATCVRVPVLRSHAESINAEFHHPISSIEARLLLEKAPGVLLFDNPTPQDASHRKEVLCGRIREDLSQKNTLDLWIVGDQLLKGAAWNALQIAQLALPIRR